MKFKINKKILSSLMVPVLSLTPFFVFISCAKNEQQNFSIELSSTEGGTILAPSTVIVVEGGTLWKNVKPAVKADENHYFVGWFNKATNQPISDDEKIKSDVIFEARFEPTTITINFASEVWAKLSGDLTQEFKHDITWGEIKDLAPAYEADETCTFDGWYINNEKILDSTTLANGDIITARFITPYTDTDNIFGFNPNNHHWLKYNFDASESIHVHDENTQEDYEIDKANFNDPVFIGNKVLSLNSFFLHGCQNFNKEIIIPESVASIGDYFMLNCTSFNQPISMSNNLRSIGTYFLGNCKSFNQPLVLSNSLTSINSFFLASCEKFNQNIYFPLEMHEIGSFFLSYCHSFNKPLSLSYSSLESIGDHFLYDCSSFNNPIKLSNSLRTVYPYFLSECKSMCSRIDLQYLNPINVFRNCVGDVNSLSSTNKNSPMVKIGIEIAGKWVSEFMNIFPNQLSDPPYRLLTYGW